MRTNEPSPAMILERGQCKAIWEATCDAADCSQEVGVWDSRQMPEIVRESVYSGMRTSLWREHVTSLGMAKEGSKELHSG